MTTTNMKTKVINIYGGPGVGKSTFATGLFYQMKCAGIKCEYTPEYVKDVVYENRTNLLKNQEYLFVQQLSRMRRLVGNVDYIVTDSPLLQYVAYIPEDFELPSLELLILEAYDMFDNTDILLERVNDYQTHGRYQTEEQAKAIDEQTMSILNNYAGDFYILPANDESIKNVLKLVRP